VSYAVSLLLGALAIGAVEAWERSVAPAAVAPFAKNRSSLVVQVSTAGCRLQNIVKRRAATDGRPALRTALYTWGPATRTRLPGGSADTAAEGQGMEAAREATRSPSLQMRVAGGLSAQRFSVATVAAATQTNGEEKHPKLPSPYVNPRAGWLHEFQPTPGTIVTCSNTIDA